MDKFRNHETIPPPFTSSPSLYLGELKDSASKCETKLYAGIDRVS